MTSAADPSELFIVFFFLVMIFIHLLLSSCSEVGTSPEDYSFRVFIDVWNPVGTQWTRERTTARRTLVSLGPEFTLRM